MYIFNVYICVNIDVYIPHCYNAQYPDTIRAELLSAYGNKLETTPNLDKFIEREGVIFNNHIAQHSQCSPSRTAMITGRYMHCLGHRTQQHLTQYWEPNYCTSFLY